MERLTVGYMPLIDAAPLILAQSAGLFAAQGLDVTLRRVTSWARMRDLLANGDLDAAHMLAPMVVASALGLEPVGQFTTALSLNLGGNAITLARSIYRQLDQYRGPCTASRLKIHLEQRREAGDPPLIFASVYPFSSHSYQLRHWLETGGINPDRDVRLVVVPPPKLPGSLARGEVAGYCVGEPWSLVAERAGDGMTITTAQSLLGRAPEKVLAVRESWADEAPETHAKLVRAVYAACQKLDNQQTRKEVAALLRDRDILNVDCDILDAVLDLSGGAPDFIRFCRDDANRPAFSDAMGFARQMRQWGQIASDVDLDAACRRAYRTDAFEAFIPEL